VTLPHNATTDYQARQSKKSELGKKRSELKEMEVKISDSLPPKGYRLADQLHFNF
jgi:hypothetical protein